MDKMRYTHDEILSGLKKEGDPDTSCNKDGPEDVTLRERDQTPKANHNINTLV